MAAIAKILTFGNHGSNGEHTVFKWRQVMTLPKILDVEEHWMPIESKIDPERVSHIMQKLGTCLKKMERSGFFKGFIEQFESPDISALLRWVIGTEMKMQMVIYGIGRIELRNHPRLQLSLALLMRRKFDFIGEIEVFDPELNAIECQVLEELGCSVISIDEQCHRTATKPTLFYMPHCGVHLYDNLLRANWSADRLSKIILLGNSFKFYQSLDFETRYLVMTIRDFTEFKIQTISDDYSLAFYKLSWHFFDNVSDAKLPSISNCELESSGECAQRQAIQCLFSFFFSLSRAAFKQVVYVIFRLFKKP